MLGAVGFHVASRSWSADIASLPAGARERAADATQLVAGGQAAAVGDAVGPEAVEPALNAFVGGFRAAMWIANGVLAVSAVGAVLGLRREKMERDHG